MVLDTGSDEQDDLLCFGDVGASGSLRKGAPAGWAHAPRSGALIESLGEPAPF